MPGGALDIGLSASGRISHGELGALHGLLSALLGDSGLRHDTTRPLFTLRPRATSAVGWDAFLHSDEAVRLVEGWSGERPWKGGAARLTLGGARRVVCPKMATTWETLRVDAMTPVICHATGKDGRATRDALTAAGVQSSLRGMASHHYGLHQLMREVHVEELHSASHEARMHLPRKLHQRGAQLGWLVARCSPAAAWMLRVAEIAGLGARVGYGCGAITVRAASLGSDGALGWGERPPAPGPARGAVGRWFVTPHAVKRYRVRAGLPAQTSYERALGLCIREGVAASFQRRLESGAELWRSPRGLGFVVGAGEGVKPALVTVLGVGDDDMTDATMVLT